MTWTEQLWDAIELGDVELVRQAVANGADVHATDLSDSSDYNALMLTLVGSLKKPNEICEVLFQAGANPNQRDADGQTALYWSTFRGDDDLVRRLIKHGASVGEEQPEDGYFSLHCAAEDGYLSIAQQLLEAGGRGVLDTFDYINCTPLMCAVVNNHYEIAQLLIKAGSNVNAFDEPQIGNTALRDIGDSGSTKMIKLLLEAGADPNIPGWMQITALDLARERVEKSKRPSAEALANLKLMEEKAR